MRTDWLKDFTYALRALAARPGFSAVAIASLAMGIGLNTTIFSVVNAVLLRPTPVQRPGELARVYTNKPGEMAQYSTSSYRDYLDLRNASTVFSGLAGHSLMMVSFTQDGVSQLLMGEIVTANYFDLLGINALLGRGFSPEEERAPGDHPVALISHGLWQRSFGGDAAVLGKPIQLDGLAYTVIGVAPPDFAGLTAGFNAELWVPIMMADEVQPVGMNNVDGIPATDSRILERGRRWMFLTGRLKDDATLEKAQSELSTLAARLAQDHPDANEDIGFTVVAASDVRLHPELDRMLTPIAALLMSVVGIVLLIACANVANMLLAKATSRRKEIALRLAIGAGRARLMRQLLVESILLSAAGGVFGLLLSLWTTHLIELFHPPIPISLTFDLGLDLRVLLFTFVVSILTSVVFGLAPALRAARTDLVSSLKEATHTGKAGRGFGFGSILVVSQVALSFVLLLGAGLLLRGLLAAQRLDLGFDPAPLGLVTVNPEMNRYDEARSRSFYATALERVRALPGVVSATAGTRLPLELNINLAEIWVDGHALTPDEASGFNVDVTFVDEHYFRTMDIPIVEGRSFLSSDHERSAPVIIVNQALAHKFWPGESALGRRVRTRGGTSYEIVGTARDHKVRTVGEESRPYLHFVRAQRFNPYGSILFRSEGDPAAHLESVRQQLLTMDANLVIMEVTTMEDRMALSLFTVRTGTRLLFGFGILSVLLAAVGLYGLIAYWVSQRLREIGIRMALGADRRRILGFVVERGMILAGTGVVLGIVGGVIASRVLQSYLYGIHPLDPLTYGGACLFLLAIAFLANAVPGWRAARMDPVRALHNE